MSMADSNFGGVGEVMPILFETLFFGAYSALLVFSTILLCKRSPSRTRHAMLTISMVMYTVSAVHWALVIATLYDGRSSRGFGSDIAIIYLPTINYILSDGVVLWRAWILWDRKLLLFIPPLISLVCTLATAVTSAVYYYESRVQLENSLHLPVGSNFNAQPFIKDQNLSAHLEWSTWILTFGTNLWATGLIFIRAWQHRRFLRLLSVKGTPTRNTEKALAFLVESGALYLLIWFVYISTSIALSAYGSSFVHTAISQVVGMYPTIIVIVVAMRLSTADILSRPGAEANSPMVFEFMPQNSLPQTAEDVEGSRDGSIAMKA